MEQEGDDDGGEGDAEAEGEVRYDEADCGIRGG